MGLINDRFEGVYASINAEGIISVKVNEDTPGATLVEGEMKDGTKYSKWVKKYNKISGFVTDIKFFDGKFGEQINITIQDENENIILTTGLASNYSTDFMNKAPNIDFSKKVVLVPYSFEGDDKKKKRGITVYQEDNKIQSFFVDEKIREESNFPKPKKENDKMKTKDWVFYFSEVADFLKEYIENNVLESVSKAAQSNIVTVDKGSVDEISVDDIPFD